MQISAKELRHLANDVDDMHHEAMRTFKEEAAELHLGAVRERRTFLKRSGLAAVGGTLLATGGGIATFTRLGGLAAAQGLSDTQIAGYAQSIELAAVAAYMAAAPEALRRRARRGHAVRRPPPGPRRCLRRGGRRRCSARGQRQAGRGGDPDPRGGRRGRPERRAHRPDPRLRPRPREPGGVHLRRRAHPAERPRLRRRHVDDPARSRRSTPPCSPSPWRAVPTTCSPPAPSSRPPSATAPTPPRASTRPPSADPDAT